MKFVLALIGAMALSTSAAAQSGHSGHTATAAAPAAVEGVGVVRAVNAKKGSITLDHEPIPALKWGAMTMSFKVAKPALLTKTKAGDKVRFTLHGQTITALSPR